MLKDHGLIHLDLVLWNIKATFFYSNASNPLLLFACFVGSNNVVFHLESLLHVFTLK